jgi:hypothetical protein
MKLLFLLMTFFTPWLFAASTMVPADLTVKLRDTLSEHHWEPDSSPQRIAATLPEPRKESLAAIVRIVRNEIDAPLKGNEMDTILLARCAHVLRAASDEDAIMGAFGSSLLRIGAWTDSEAVAALSSCRDGKAVEAIAELAKLRFKQISPHIPQPASAWTEDQRRELMDLECSFLYAVKGLAMSANSSGKAIARELRDKYVKLYDGSRYHEDVLRSLEAEFGIDPLLRESSRSDGSRGRGLATALTSFRTTVQSKSKSPALMLPSSERRSASNVGAAIAVVIGSMVLLGFLIWFLRRK